MRGNELGIWVDEFNFGSSTSQIDLTFEVQEAERTHLDSLAQEFLPILPKCTVAQNGYFEGVLPDGFEAELAARFGAGQAIVTVLAQKSDDHCVAYVLPEATDYSMKFSAPVANLVTLNGQWGTSAGAQRGLKVVDAWVDTTDIIAGSVTDFDSINIARGTAYFHIYEITGAAVNASIGIESATVMTYNEIATLTFSDVGGYRVELSDENLGQFIRLRCKSLGGATQIKLLVVVCLEYEE